MSKLKITTAYDGQLIKEIPLMDAQQVETSLKTLYDTHQANPGGLPAHERIAILEQMLRIFKAKRDELARQAAAEGGKPLIDSQVEVDRAIVGIKIAVANISHITGKEVPMGITPSSQNRMAFTYREPIGVVFAISAFNHPVNLVVHQIVPAIAVGCPVLIKPSSSTPISCYNVVQTLYEAGLPEEWCQVISCDNAIAENVVADKRVSFLNFIGSGRVGWYLRSKLAPGTACALEHGGAAPVIIEANANIDNALPMLVKGGFYHAGQVCVSVQRIFAHKDIIKRLAKGMTKLTQKLVVGDPTKPETEVGPLISAKEVDRVDQWVKAAIKGGAKLLCGGKQISDTCYEPTILLNPPLDSKVCREEIFGPVVCINSYDNLDQALTYANALPFCFQAAVFTENLDTAFHVVKNIKANAVMVNDQTAFRVDWMPFGGREQSGLGVGGIPYSMRELTHEKLMVFKSAAL